MRQKIPSSAAGAIFSRLEIKLLTGLVLAAFVGSAVSIVFAQDLSSDRIEAAVARYAGSAPAPSEPPAAEVSAHD
jgi:hypothetical protein